MSSHLPMYSQSLALGTSQQIQQLQQLIFSQHPFQQTHLFQFPLQSPFHLPDLSSPSNKLSDSQSGFYRNSSQNYPTPLYFSSSQQEYTSQNNSQNANNSKQTFQPIPIFSLPNQDVNANQTLSFNTSVSERGDIQTQGLALPIMRTPFYSQQQINNQQLQGANGNSLLNFNQFNYNSSNQTAQFPSVLEQYKETQINNNQMPLLSLLNVTQPSDILNNSLGYQGSNPQVYLGANPQVYLGANSQVYQGNNYPAYQGLNSQVYQGANCLTPQISLAGNNLIQENGKFNPNSQQLFLTPQCLSKRQSSNDFGLSSVATITHFAPQYAQIPSQNSQFCLLEEHEDEGADSLQIKDEHQSIQDEEESMPQQYVSLCGQSPQIGPLPVGQISATLLNRQSRMKCENLKNLKRIHPSPLNIPIIQQNHTNSSKEESNSADSVGRIRSEFEKNTDLHRSRKLLEQQQKSLRYLMKQFEIYPNQQRLVGGEFQSPESPQLHKYKKYISPLCQQYKELIDAPIPPQPYSVYQEGVDKIRKILFQTQHSLISQPLPSDYSKEFSLNLLSLVNSIHETSIIKQNPHLLFGTFSKNATSPSLSPQTSKNIADTPNYGKSIIKMEDQNQPYLQDSFFPNSSFSLRKSLKKIENPSQQDEELSCDSFGNIDRNGSTRKIISFAETLQKTNSGLNDSSPLLKLNTRLSINGSSTLTPQLQHQISSSSNITAGYDRAILGLYSRSLTQDKERSKQFATPKNTQGNKFRANPESPTVNSPLTNVLIAKRSKYHNLTKLFMYFLLSLFQQENMQRLSVPENIQQELIKCVQNIKKTAKKKIKNRNLQKTDFFNHTHYNALFLQLNKQSLRDLQQKEKDKRVHLQCFGLDLAEIDVQRLEYTNILKKFAFEIVINTLVAPSQTECLNNPRNEYMLKALSGIRQLAQGNVIFRFQQVYGSQSSDE